jgi:hypothetical protein
MSPGPDASSVHSSVTDIAVTVLKLSGLCVRNRPSLNMEDCCQWVKTEPVMRRDSDLMIEKHLTHVKWCRNDVYVWWL